MYDQSYPWVEAGIHLTNFSQSPFTNKIELNFDEENIPHITPEARSIDHSRGVEQGFILELRNNNGTRPHIFNVFLPGDISIMAFDSLHDAIEVAVQNKEKVSDHKLSYKKLGSFFIFKYLNNNYITRINFWDDTVKADIWSKEYKSPWIYENGTQLFVKKVPKKAF